VAEQVVLAVGDMCGPPRKNPGAEATAALARRLLKDHPDAIILALGDNAYNSGKYAEYQDHYAPSWGQADLLGRTWSCPGNHDYRTAAAAPYFQYFGEQRAGTPSRSYYSVPLPSAGWHLVSLNSEIEQDAHSPQLRWLRDDLAARRFAPILAIWHRPRWGSGAHRDSKKPRWFLNEMYAARAEVILNGHAHHYERFAPQRPDQIPDPQGPRQFIVGTGGRKLQGRTKDTPNSEYARFDQYGLLKLTLKPDAYRWEFISVDSRVLDTGEQQTHEHQSLTHR
jgi:acid phosphatase type 7